MKIELKNDFHNTKIQLNIPIHSASGEISQQQVKRAKKTLCGSRTCLCSGIAGTRGPQFQPRIIAGAYAKIEPNIDRSATINLYSDCSFFSPFQVEKLGIEKTK